MKKFLIVFVFLSIFIRYFMIDDNIIEVSNETINIISNDLSHLTIDKGSSSNIEEGDMVLSNEALVGIIEEVNPRTSVVRLITDDKNKVSVKVNNIYGVIDNYEDGFLVMNVIRNNNLEIASKVVTTGIGYIYAADIYVGDIYKIEDFKILIKTPVNFNNIENLVVLKK